MKYLHKHAILNGHDWDMGYMSDCLPPIGKPIWAIAYDVNNETGHVNYRCKPVKGIILDGQKRKPLLMPKNLYSSSWLYFWSYKKDSEELKSKPVQATHRLYADTYEEAAELYNDLIDNRIKRLKAMIEEAYNEMIDEEIPEIEL